MDHVDYLRRYNAWRRGEDERTFEESGLSATDIGVAITALVDEVETLRRLLRAAEPHVYASAGAAHMLDGFRPKRHPIDDLMDEIKDAIMEK